MWGIPGFCPVCLAEEVQPQQGLKSLGELPVGTIRGQGWDAQPPTCITVSWDWTLEMVCVLLRELKGLAQGHIASQLVAGDDEI